MAFSVHINPQPQRTVQLPASKSLSNRALLLCTLSEGSSKVENISLCDDTLVMQRALINRPTVVNIGAAGTAMRFLTAYFSASEGEEHVLTGTQRMKQRPIGILVEALRSLGAHITYEEQEGFPPIRIHGCKLLGGTIELPANVSSQYISSLLMLAPTMEKGLRLHLRGNIISRPYIDMTLSLMRFFGAKVGWENENLLVADKGIYRQDVVYEVESDWSAASYWFEIVALHPDQSVRIVLPGLTENSLQGDACVRKFFEPLGVRTHFADGAAILTKDKSLRLPKEETYFLNLVNQPDLAQTLVVSCAILRQPFRFEGLRSLRIKETDRMDALQNELKKFGIDLGIDGDEALFIEHYKSGFPTYSGLPIQTYKDHRMAMSFAPTALVFPGVEVEEPEVVSKSYPNFWEDIQ